MKIMINVAVLTLVIPFSFGEDLWAIVPHFTNTNKIAELRSDNAPQFVTTALSLALHTFSIPAAYGNPRTDTERFPRIVGAVQFPQTRWKIVRHTIRIQIPQQSQALSELTIDVPPGLTVRNQMTITDQSGQKLNANVSVNGRQVIVVFPDPVAPGTQLEIDMNNVKISGVSNAWLYHVSAKIVGFDRKIPLGVAQIRAYI